MANLGLFISIPSKDLSGIQSVDYAYIYTGPVAFNPITENDYRVFYNGAERNNVISPLTNVSILNHATNINRPAVYNIKLVSNNANNQHAKAGDIVTMTFNQDYEIETLTLNIAGNSITPSKTGNDYTATYTVVTNTPNTALQFSLWADGVEFTDTSGSGRCSRVLVDTVKPVVTLTDKFDIKSDITTQELINGELVTTVIGHIYDLYTTIKVSEKTNKLELTDLIISGGKVLRLYQDTEGYKLKIRPDYDPVNYVSPSVQIQVNQDALKDDAGNGNLLVNHTSIVT